MNAESDRPRARVDRRASAASTGTALEMLRRPAVVSMAALLFATLAVRLWNLGRGGLWVDEAYTVWLIDVPFGEILERLRSDDAPPLYYFLQKVLLALFGTSEAAVRLLSALASWGSVLVIFSVVRPRDRRAAWMAAAALGFSTLSIFYAQQARSYALVHLLTAVLLALVVRFRERPSRRLGWSFAAAGLALLYTHNLGLWSLAAGAIALVPELRRRESRGPLLWMAGILAVGAIPWLLSALRQTEVHELNAWMGQWWSTRSMALAPLYTGAVLTNATASTVRPPVPLPAIDATSPARFLLWAITLTGFILGSIAAFARSRDGKIDSTPPVDSPPSGSPIRSRAESSPDGLTTIARVALLFVAVPLLGLIVTTYIVGPVYVVGRTDTLVLPAFAILLGLGWSRIRLGWLRWSLLAVWILSAVAPLTKSNAPWIKGSDRALASLLADRAQAGDALLVPALGRPSLEYYAKRQEWYTRLTAFSSFPRQADENPAAVYPTPLDSTAVYMDEARSLRRSLEERGVRRVWCVAVIAEAKANWPSRPNAPPAERAVIDANAVTYPTSIFLHSLVGLAPVRVVAEFRQDWVGGDRVLLEIPRQTWIDPDSLPSVEIRQ